MSELLFEGYTADELLDLPDEQIDDIVLTNEALIVRIGSARLLGRFTVQDDALILELGHIDEGGEGVLPGLAALATRFARRRNLHWLEWRVHAVHCAAPNLRLRRMLELKGFEIREMADVGECYWKRQPVPVSG